MTLPALLDPLVDSATDCRGLPFMPLHTTRLLDSDFLALSTGDEFKAAAILWCRSWASVPASSLPDNDRILARWVSCSLKEWLAMREMVLRGFVKCADGLLYHPLIADLAAKAYANRRIQQARSESRWSKVRLARTGENAAKTKKVAIPRHSGGTAAVIQVKDKGKVEEKEKNTIPGEGAECGKVVAGSGKPKPAKAQRATRVPMAWTANEAERKYAEDQGFNPTETRDMEDAFYDFWKAKPGTAGTKLDWSATWRTWVRTEAKRRGGHRGPNGNGSGRSPSPGGRREEREERIGRMLGGAVEALGGKR